MQSFRTPISALVLAMFATAGTAIAQQAQDPHHPDATPSRTSVDKAPADSADHMARMDRQMHDMRIMHDRMMKAKTSEERSALMAEHAKAMQGAMSMMGGMMGSRAMAGSGATTSPQVMAQQIAMMQKQMQMMHSMMQMMLDRMSMQAK